MDCVTSHFAEVRVQADLLEVPRHWHQRGLESAQKHREASGIVLDVSGTFLEASRSFWNGLGWFWNLLRSI